jgi:hypothetical protein
MSRVHASIRRVIENTDRIDLEDMAAYLEILLSHKQAGSGATWGMVADYLGKVIDGINDVIDAPEPELEERKQREVLELQKAIDRVSELEAA